MNYSKNHEYKLKGSLKFNENLFIVYEIINIPEIITYKSSDTLYFTTLYEILYFNSFLNFKVNNKVYDFFCNHYKKFLSTNQDKTTIKYPIQVYLEVDKHSNIFTLLNNFDEKKEKKFVIHKQSATKSKNIIRCLLIENEDIEIHGNKFYFTDSNNFLIISIFD